jgi:hypothetical protein
MPWARCAASGSPSTAEMMAPFTKLCKEHEPVGVHQSSSQGSLAKDGAEVCHVADAGLSGGVLSCSSDQSLNVKPVYKAPMPHLVFVIFCGYGLPCTGVVGKS